MKMKTLVAGFLMIAIFISMGTVANAAVSTQHCYVTKAGVNDQGDVEIWIDIVGGLENSHMYLAPTVGDKAMLAVALTAMTQGLTVEARMDWKVSGSELEWLRLEETNY